MEITAFVLWLVKMWCIEN